MNDEQLRERVQELVFFPPRDSLATSIADRLLELVKEEKALSYGLGYQDGQRKVRHLA